MPAGGLNAGIKFGTTGGRKAHENFGKLEGRPNGATEGMTRNYSHQNNTAALIQPIGIVNPAEAACLHRGKGIRVGPVGRASERTDLLQQAPPTQRTEVHLKHKMKSN